MLKRMIPLLLGLALALSAPTPSRGDTFLVGGSGALALPEEDLKTFTDDTPLEGGSLEFRNLRWSRFSWGVSLGVTVFSYRSNDPTDIAGLTVGGGDQYRWTTTVPMLLTGHWYPVKNLEGLTVFLGGGTGLTRAIRRVDVAWNRSQEDSWHFSAAPEIGFLIPVGWVDWKLLAKAQYHYGFDNGDHWGPRYLTLGLGVAEF